MFMFYVIIIQLYVKCVGGICVGSILFESISFFFLFIGDAGLLQ